MKFHFSYLYLIIFSSALLLNSRPLLGGTFSSDGHSLIGRYLRGTGGSAEQREKMGDKPAKKAKKRSVAKVLSTADRFLTDGKVLEAVSMLEKAVRRWPLNVKLRLALGLAYERLHGGGRAMDTYREILKIDPDNVNAMASLGYLMIENNLSSRKYTKLLSRALDLKPSCGRALDAFGWAAFRKRKNRTAEKYFRKASEAVPDDPSPYYHLGLVALRQNKIAMALTNFQQVTELDPSHDKAFISLGILYSRMGERRKAVLSLNKAYVIAEGNTTVLKSVRELLRKISPHWQPSDAVKMRYTFRRPGLRKDFFTASDFNVPSKNELSQLSGDSGSVSTGKTDSRKVEVTGGRKDGFLSGPGVTGDRDSVSHMPVQHELEKGISLLPDADKYKRTADNHKTSTMSVEKVLAASEGLVKQNLVSKHMRLGRLYYEFGLMHEAASEFQTVINISPLSVEAREARELVIPLSDFEELSADEKIDGLFKVAASLFSHSDNEGAILQYQKILLIDDSNAVAHKNLAYIYLKNGMQNEAWSHIRDALTVEPEQADALIIKGFILAKRRNFIDAQKAFSMAAAHTSPDSVTGRYARNMSEKMAMFTDLK